MTSSSAMAMRWFRSSSSYAERRVTVGSWAIGEVVFLMAVICHPSRSY